MMTLNFKRQSGFYSRRYIPSNGSGTVDLKQIVAYLKEMDVAFEVFLRQEPWFYSPSELASAIGLPVQIMAKVIMLKAADTLVLAILPAGWSVDLDRVNHLLEIPETRLAAEEEVRQRFCGCEIGSIPPFGNLYDLPVCVDFSLLQNEEIAFQVGTHHQVVKLRVQDFLRLVCPKVGDIRLRPLRMSSEF